MFNTTAPDMDNFYRDFGLDIGDSFSPFGPFGPFGPLCPLRSCAKRVREACSRSVLAKRVREACPLLY